MYLLSVLSPDRTTEISSLLTLSATYQAIPSAIPSSLTELLHKTALAHHTNRFENPTYAGLISSLTAEAAFEHDTGIDLYGSGQPGGGYSRIGESTYHSRERTRTRTRSNGTGLGASGVGMYPGPTPHPTPITGSSFTSPSAPGPAGHTRTTQTQAQSPAAQYYSQTAIIGPSSSPMIGSSSTSHTPYYPNQPQHHHNRPSSSGSRSARNSPIIQSSINQPPPPLFLSDDSPPPLSYNRHHQNQPQSQSQLQHQQGLSASAASSSSTPLSASTTSTAALATSTAAAGTGASNPSLTLRSQYGRFLPPPPTSPPTRHGFITLLEEVLSKFYNAEKALGRDEEYRIRASGGLRGTEAGWVWLATPFVCCFVRPVAVFLAFQKLMERMRKCF